MTGLRGGRLARGGGRLARGGGGCRGRPAAIAVLLMALATVGYLGLLAGTGRPRGALPARPTRTAARALVDFSLVLRMPGRERLTRFLAELYNPASPEYHHFIDARSFGERFGVSSRVLRGAAAQLAGDGVQITADYPQRTALDVRAPSAVIERLFGVRMMDYRGLGGRRYHAPVGQPVIPAALRSAVSAVAGLDGGASVKAEDVPSGGLTPSVARLAYNTTPLYRQGVRGEGENVAIISLASYAQSDLDKFDQRFGLPPLTPREIPIAGGATDTSPGDETETELDMEVVHEIAPNAQILDYSAPPTSASGADSFGDTVDRIVADGQANVVSDSWGSCELMTPQADIARDEQAIEAAVAHGITIFKSTGDAGAYQCQPFNTRDHRLSTEWPASSPGVVAVGGTSLSVTATGAYAGETSWQDTLEQGGGGGGLSAYFLRPAWQRALGVDNRFSNGKRQVPDVSADADSASGWAMYTGGQLGQVGGTSAASPFWAASMALIEQYARRHGVQRLGFVAPVLYAVASSPQPSPPFHDITVGSNRYYPATVGWDFATGLGSPNVDNLAQDMVSYLQAHPAGG